MRRQSITSIMILICFGFIGATAVTAQSTRRFVIRIPFDFTIAGQHLPAGKYAIERIDPTKPNLVLVKNTDNGRFRLFMTQRVEDNNTPAESSLIFKRRKGEFHLFQLWMLGYNDGNQVPSADRNEGRVQPHELTIVKRKAGNKKS